jgi:predicted Zn-dependent protease
VRLRRLAPEDPEFVPYPGAAKLAPIEAAWSEKTALQSPAERAQLVADAIAQAKKRGVVLAGFLSQTARTEAVATRRGFFGVHHGTTLTLSTTARTSDGSGTGSGWASTGGVQPAQLDVAAATERACETALQSRKPQPLDPGVYPVVLEAAAVAELLDYLGWSLEQRSADEGRSFASKPGGGTRVGEKLLGALTLRCDPRSTVLPSAPFDHEGMVREAPAFIDGGVLKRLRVSRYWAKKTGVRPDAWYGEKIASGGTASRADLIGGLDRGLVVTRFWYTNLLDPKTLTVTGLTRDGVFLVEKGKIVRPVNNFRFNQSILDLFAQTDAYGPAVRIDSDEVSNVAPPLRCARFHMASRSDAV